MTIQAPGQVQFEQRHLDCSAWCAGKPDDLIDGHGRRSEQFFDRAKQVAVAVHPLSFSALVSRSGRRKARLDRTDSLKHIGSILDQRGALADELVATLRPRIERRARHRHHFPARFRRKAGGNQRS
jgi:hypothetical protein